MILKDLILDYNKTRSTEIKDNIISYIENTSVEELKLKLYDELVPGQGKADTVAGEIIRAINTIGYRYFKEQDVYFYGNGLDTVGSSAVYLSKLNKALETLIIRLYPEQYLITGNKEASYKNFIETLETRLIQLIKKTPNLVIKRNTEDSRTRYTTEADNFFMEYDEVLNNLDYDIDMEERL